MIMKIQTQLVSHRKATFKGVNQKKYITIHETGNRKRGANAQAHAQLQQKGFHASWHWQVDDQVAIQSYPHTVQCWHAGDGEGTGNLASIAIEICVNEDGDYHQAIQNAILLTKHIMKEEHIPASRVVQHHHWSRKDCPEFLRSGKKGVNWGQFKQQIQSGGSHIHNTDQTIKFGHTGKGVEQLQQRLNRLGYTVLIDGSFGQETLFAIRFFQARHRLVVDGIAGPKTREMLLRLQQVKQAAPIRVVQYGQKNEAVAVVQQSLNQLGEQLAIDQSFGPKTLQAVRTFQITNRLVIDGHVGPLTWEALHQSIYS